MQFILGILVGLLVSAVIFIILAFFRAGIEKRVRIIETKLGSAGPKPKGAIFIPDSEEDIVRQEIIDKNAKEGRDTPISQLI